MTFTFFQTLLIVYNHYVRRVNENKLRTDIKINPAESMMI